VFIALEAGALRLDVDFDCVLFCVDFEELEDLEVLVLEADFFICLFLL
jgi:hypothetical protein